MDQLGRQYTKDKGTHGTEETTLTMPQGGALCILIHFVLDWNGKI